MPIGTTPLNDGHHIPNLAFGTGSSLYGKDVTEEISIALATGFRHVDTAQAYGNEASVGKALKKWLTLDGLDGDELKKKKRKEVWVTTKYGGGERGPLGELKQSLKKLQLDYVDLYLIHQPRLLGGDAKATWREFERAKEMGLAKSIGVSNFDATQLEELFKVTKIKPAVNQIRLHPYLYQANLDTLQLCKEHDIVVESYGSLYPITQNPTGPVTAALVAPAARLGATLGQVLFLWDRAKGAVIVTTSSKEERMREYLGIGELGGLMEEEVNAIDAAAATTPSVPTLVLLATKAEIPSTVHGLQSLDQSQATSDDPMTPLRRRLITIHRTLSLIALTLVLYVIFVGPALPELPEGWSRINVCPLIGIGSVIGALFIGLVLFRRARMMARRRDERCIRESRLESMEEKI